MGVGYSDEGQLTEVIMGRVIICGILASTILTAVAIAPSAAEPQKRELTVINDLAKHRKAGIMPIDTFRIVIQANTGNVWVIDTASGALRVCMPPKLKGGLGTPECFPWGDVRE